MQCYFKLNANISIETLLYVTLHAKQGYSFWKLASMLMIAFDKQDLTS